MTTVANDRLAVQTLLPVNRPIIHEVKGCL